MIGGGDEENYRHIYPCDTIMHTYTIKGETAGFKEPKVAGLWRIAKEADFDDDELESLREELG